MLRNKRSARQVQRQSRLTRPGALRVQEGEMTVAGNEECFLMDVKFLRWILIFGGSRKFILGGGKRLKMEKGIWLSSWRHKGWKEVASLP